MDLVGGALAVGTLRLELVTSGLRMAASGCRTALDSAGVSRADVRGAGAVSLGVSGLERLSTDLMPSVLLAGINAGT
jgi:hypothetical protein